MAIKLLSAAREFVGDACRCMCPRPNITESEVETAANDVRRNRQIVEIPQPVVTQRINAEMERLKFNYRMVVIKVDDAEDPMVNIRVGRVRTSSMSALVYTLSIGPNLAKQLESRNLTPIEQVAIAHALHYIMTDVDRAARIALAQVAASFAVYTATVYSLDSFIGSFPSHVLACCLARISAVYARNWFEMNQKYDADQWVAEKNHPDPVPDISNVV